MKKILLSIAIVLLTVSCGTFAKGPKDVLPRESKVINDTAPCSYWCPTQPGGCTFTCPCEPVIVEEPIGCKCVRLVPTC